MIMKKERFNFYKDFRLDVLCSDDEFRPVQQHIFFSDNRAWITDSHLLFRMDLDSVSTLPTPSIEKLNEKAIHKDVFKKLLAYDEIIPMDDNIEARKYKNDVVDYFEYAKLTQGEKSEWSFFENSMKPLLTQYLGCEDSQSDHTTYSFAEIKKIWDAFGSYTAFRTFYKKDRAGSPFSVIIPYNMGDKYATPNESDNVPIIGLLMGFID